MPSSTNASPEAGAGYAESASSFVTNPYAQLSESNPGVLPNPYGDPNQPPSGSRYSFTSATNEPRNFIRQDANPSSTEHTSPATILTSRSKRSHPESYAPTRNLLDAPINLIRTPTHRSVRNAERDISGDTLLDLRPEAQSEELQIRKMQMSFSEPEAIPRYPKRSDTKFGIPGSSPFNSVKNLLFDLKDLPDDRNPFATVPQDEHDGKIERNDTVINTGLSPERTVSVPHPDHQIRNPYAASHTTIIKECSSPQSPSIAGSLRTASLSDAIGRPPTGSP
jgi:hypothetical protein